MRNAVDTAVIICMMIALYFNLTSLPTPEQPRVVRGQLERIAK